MKNLILIFAFAFAFTTILTPQSAFCATTIAIIEVQPGPNVSRSQTELVTNLLQQKIYDSRAFIVVEREKLLNVLNEQKLTMAGLTLDGTSETNDRPDSRGSPAESHLIHIGELLSAQKLLFGNLTLTNGTWNLSIRLIDATSAKVEFMNTVIGFSANQIADETNALVLEIIKNVASHSDSHSMHQSSNYNLNSTPGEKNTYSPTDVFNPAKMGVAANFVAMSLNLVAIIEMQTTPVTQLQYFSVMNTNPAVFRKQADCDDDNYLAISDSNSRRIELCANHPMENVSIKDTQEFIRRLNTIQQTYIYRLPTESEWELAAKQDPSLDSTSTSETADTVSWYGANSNGRTHAVATKEPNALGFYDMLGNVCNWIMADTFRGANWDSNIVDLDPTRRYQNDYWSNKEHRMNVIGFRLVRKKRM